MVGIAQLVSAPDCGSGGQGFESLYPPCLHGETLGYRQAVRHSTLTAAFAGSNPASPVKRKSSYGALAQSVEHLTFNQVVRGSNPRCFIAEKRRKPCIYAGLRCFCVLKNKLFWAVWNRCKCVISVSPKSRYVIFVSKDCDVKKKIILISQDVVRRFRKMLWNEWFFGRGVCTCMKNL